MSGTLVDGVGFVNMNPTIKIKLTDPTIGTLVYIRTAAVGKEFDPDYPHWLRLKITELFWARLTQMENIVELHGLESVTCTDFPVDWEGDFDIGVVRLVVDDENTFYFRVWTEDNVPVESDVFPLEKFREQVLAGTVFFGNHDAETWADLTNQEYEFIKDRMWDES